MDKKPNKTDKAVIRKIKKKFKNLYNGSPNSICREVNKITYHICDLLAIIYFYTKNEEQIKRIYYNSPLVLNDTKGKAKNPAYFNYYLDFVKRTYKNDTRPFAYLRRNGK